jgi:very-short-patch-repair endonuclease
MALDRIPTEMALDRTPAEMALDRIPSPLWGEGRVRGDVHETPRKYERSLRRKQKDAERRLWARLRDRRFDGTKFRRQHPIGSYIVDFCCPQVGLVIELDGGQHATRPGADATRTAFLHSEGYRVLRFWNSDVLGNMDGVLQRIAEVFRDPHPDPLPGRERGEARAALGAEGPPGDARASGPDTRPSRAEAGR